MCAWQRKKRTPSDRKTGRHREIHKIWCIQLFFVVVAAAAVTVVFVEYVFLHQHHCRCYHTPEKWQSKSERTRARVRVREREKEAFAIVVVILSWFSGVATTISVNTIIISYVSEYLFIKTILFKFRSAGPQASDLFPQNSGLQSHTLSLIVIRWDSCRKWQTSNYRP